MLSQQPRGQLQAQKKVDITNYIMDKYNIKSKTNYRQALEEKHINAEKWTNKQTNKQTEMRRGNKNYITQYIRIVAKGWTMKLQWKGYVTPPGTVVPLPPPRRGRDWLFKGRAGCCGKLCSRIRLIIVPKISDIDCLISRDFKILINIANW
jgi:hypothetical protein